MWMHAVYGQKHVAQKAVASFDWNVNFTAFWIYIHLCYYNPAFTSDVTILSSPLTYFGPFRWLARIIMHDASGGLCEVMISLSE